VPKKLLYFFIIGVLETIPNLSHAEETDPGMEQLLRLSLEDLQQLTITTAGKHEERVSDIPASVTVVTRADIADLGYTTLAEIIEDIPGVYKVDNYSGAASNFGVRGNLNPRWQNTNFAILVNGVNQLNDYDRSNPLEKIRVPVEAIERIELIRGPMSVIYGNGAFFGVINIITNQPQLSNTTFSAGYGPMNTSKYSARKTSIDNPFKYTLNASIYKTDGMDNKFSKMMTADNLATLPSLGISDPNYSTHKLLQDKSSYLGFNGEYNGFFLDTTYEKADTELFVLFPSVEDGTIDHVKNTNITLGYKTKPKDTWGINSKFSYNKYEYSTDFDMFYPNFYGVHNIDFESYEGEFIVEHSQTGKLNVIFGLNYRTMRHLKDYIDIPDLGVYSELVLIAHRNTRGLFTQGTFTISPQLSIVAGYRYENTEAFDYKYSDALGTNFNRPRDAKINKTPRIAGIYKIDAKQTVKLMYGIASRVSEDAYDPETIETTEINYAFNSANLTTSLGVYKNNLDNLLVKRLDIDAKGAHERDSPTGKITASGVELIVNSEFSRALSGEFSIASQNSSDRSNDNIDPGFSPKIIAHSKLSYRLYNKIYSLSARYIDSMKTLYNPAIDNGDGSYGARVGKKVDGYFVLDANFRIDKLYDRFYFNFRATNLLNTEIHYPNEAFYTEILNKGTIGPGRAFFATIGYTY